MPRPWWERAAGPILIGWVLLNYGWTVWFGLMNDDYIWIAGARVGATGSWWRAALVPPVWSGAFVRPLVQLSFFLNYLVNGNAPAGYHLVNLLLHCANSYLVWRVASEVLRGAGPRLLVALLFAVHPAHHDAVTWVSGRTELIAAGLFLAAVLLHVRQRTAGAALLFGLALLAQESAASFPLVAVALSLVGPGKVKVHAGAIAVYGAILGAYLVIRRVSTTYFAMGLLGWNIMARGDLAGLVRFVAHQGALASWRLLAPLPFTGPVAVLAFGVLVCTCLWVTRAVETRRVAWLAVLWIALTLSPFLGLWAFQSRYVYLASVGFALLVVTAGSVASARVAHLRWLRVAILGGTAVWLIACAAALQAQNEQLRRNGIMSTRIIEAVATAVPRPPPHAFFILSGLEALRIGFAPGVRSPVLMFGLQEALQMQFDDRSLDVRFAETPQIFPGAKGRPVIRLRWDGQRNTFVSPDAPPH